MSVIMIKKYRDEESFDDTLSHHPKFPRLLALKIDVQRRGVHYTQRALDAVDPAIHQLYNWGEGDRPHSLLLRDSTTILIVPHPLERDPYVVDYIDGLFVLTDEGRVIEAVDLWRRPAYYDKFTTSGRPMKEIVSARPQRLDIFSMSFCYFHVGDLGCKFCSLPALHQYLRTQNNLPRRPHAQDITECIVEAIKEPGRFTNIHITGGSIFKGEEAFDMEVDLYVEIMQAIGQAFSTPKFPSQLLASAFTEKQLVRLYEETGLSSFTSDIEVLNERLFDWICPGKSKWIGYQEWKRRLIRAVDIFGRGRVGTGIVGGVEMASPHGFRSEHDALASTLDEAESLARHGVTTVHTVWAPLPGSPFADQKAPSLDYFIRLARGLQDLREAYGLTVDFDNYRRCGNHPDSDLARLQ